MEQIVGRICEGESLRQICRDPEMPSRATVMRWQNENPEFEARCARAREWQADYMDDKILEAAENCTNENAQAARVKISAYQWRASKLAPKRYGDRVDLKHSGDAENPVAVVHKIERQIVRSKPNDSDG